ncbi:MAG: methyl-accepting chemotaxis protein [Oscillospiraceae bacterium]|nr:methyl-accepting chemotaxis protein [Oscillospiraceae bacterium]
MSEAWAKIKTNRMILIMNVIVCAALTAGYTIDLLKGRKTLIFVGVFLAVIIAELCVCAAVFKKNKESDSFKHYSLAGYMIIYCFAIFSSDTYFTYVYIFPLIVLFILYNEPSYVRMIGIITVILNLFKIGLQIYHGHTGDTDITSYMVQFACVLIFCVGMYFVTKLIVQINEERVEKLLETNKEVSELARKAEETSKAESILMNEIVGISSSFISASKHISDAAQNLAQQTTQQAATSQQLSGAVSEITEKTRTNAQMAERASKLAAVIKDGATEGNRHMDDMVEAVREIDGAGKSISKVIKTIDDIAFQTNILALNAAVEAARAGTAGKGFAVVAEEVRNLANKSAEAAKDTSGLIENSMKKAALGMSIATQTAESLREIVSGINESSQLIEDIATMSEEQSSGISQINTGIGQITEVIQQNSATAEESAASAEQMSAQANFLEDLIRKFRSRTGQ